VPLFVNCATPIVESGKKANDFEIEVDYFCKKWADRYESYGAETDVASEKLKKEILESVLEITKKMTERLNLGELWKAK